MTTVRLPLAWCTSANFRRVESSCAETLSVPRTLGNLTRAEAFLEVLSSPVRNRLVLRRFAFAYILLSFLRIK